MVDMVENIMEAARTVTRTAEVLKEYEVLRSQFNNVLDLLLPGDGNDLLPLHGQDWPALKDRGHHVDGGPIAGHGVRGAT